MKKNSKKIFASVAATLSAAAMTVGSVSADYLGNDIVKKEEHEGYYNKEEILYFSDGEMIDISRKSDFKISYMTPLSDDALTPDYFGVEASGFIIKKSKTNTIYTVKVNDEETLDKLFENANQLYKDGKITNAYTSMNIGHGCGHYEDIENLDVLIFCEVAHASILKTYIDPDNTEEAYWGDVNNDGLVNARDPAAIARAIAAKTVSELEAPENADFNQDGTVNIRDAAAIAHTLAQSVTKPIPNPNSGPMLGLLTK